MDKRLKLITFLTGIFMLFHHTNAWGFTSNIIMELDVKGNEQINKDAILKAVTSKVGEKVTPEKIQEDVNRIYALGYFSDVGADVSDVDKGKKITYEVLENATVKKITVEGNTLLSSAEIKEVMKTKEGAIFNVPLLNEDGKRINDLYAKNGYLFSGVTDFDVREAGEYIHLKITEATLEKIVLEGNKKTKDYVILKQITIKPGEIFNSDKVMRSLQKIFNLGFFKNVKPHYSRGEKPGGVVLTIEMEEQKTGMATLGGGYSSANGFVGFVEVSQNNFQGKAQKISCKLEVGGVTNYELSFSDPWFYHNTSFGVDLYSTKIEREEIRNQQVVSIYDEKRKGGAVTLGRPTGRNTTTSLKFTDEDVVIEPKSGAVPETTEGAKQSLMVLVLKDTRDNYLNPSKGRRDSFSLETTGGFLKGSASYTKYTTRIQRYFRLTEKLISANRFIYGFTTESSGSIPFYDQYFIGGGYTLRGYEFREYYGTKEMLLNLEVRYPLDDKLSGVIFFDSGDAWGGANSGRSIDLKNSYGFGIMFNSPIGTIRLDYGIPTSGRSGRSHFSMGQIF